MNFSEIGCSHLECAHLHVRSVCLSLFSMSGLMNSEDTKKRKCMDGYCVFAVDRERDFYSCISQYQKLACFDSTDIKLIGNIWLISLS